MKNNNLINSISTNLIGILTIILGVACFAASLYIYSSPIDEPDFEEIIYKSSYNCMNLANDFYKNQNKDIMEYKNELSSKGYKNISENIIEFDVIEDKEYKASVSSDNKSVTIRKFDISNGKKELLEIENIISSCKNMKLVKFCIGKKEESEEFSNYGCPLEGLEAVLEYENSYDSWSYFQ